MTAGVVVRSVSTEFLGDRRGNFAIISSLVVLPLLLSVGMAVDYSTIIRTRSNLQNALDAAVLAAAREGQHVDDAKARRIAEIFVAENFRQPVSNLKLVHEGTSFTLRGQAVADIAFGPLFGYNGWLVGASSSADIAYASYEVGLVLDTTGSMAGGKLIAMKEAVNGLIDDMSAQVNDKNKLKFALIPFASFVNVGPGFGPSFDKDGKQIEGTGAAWLDLNGKSPLKQSELSAGASRFQLYNNLGQKWPGCVETREAGNANYDVTDAPADTSKPESLFVPAFGIDEPDGKGYNNSYISSDAKVADNSATERQKRWAKYGVATDASGNPLLNGQLQLVGSVVSLLTGGQPTTIPIDVRTVSGYGKTGPGFGCVTEPIVPLSSDYASMKSKVNAMTASGNTNVMEGVAWGMRVLSPGAPFTEGVDPKKENTQKIMIVLTDGTNTFTTKSNTLGSTYSSFGYLVDGRLGASSGGANSTTATMNARTLAACTNAKAQGIEVYTIRLEEPDVATGTMLKDCASSPENYFDVPSRAQLDAAFGKIKEHIATVRISS